MTNLSAELEDFRGEINRELVFGDLADIDLPVVDDAGECNVVVALADEKLEALNRRITNAGGYANVFVRNGDEVIMLSAVSDSCALSSDATVDMTGERRPSMNSSIGIFIEFVKRQHDGVRLPVHGHELSPKMSVDRELQLN